MQNKFSFNGQLFISNDIDMNIYFIDILTICKFQDELQKNVPLYLKSLNLCVIFIVPLYLKLTVPLNIMPSGKVGQIVIVQFFS